MKDLTSGNIYKNFILFAIPLVLSGLLSQAYSLVDTVIAGQCLGESGLAAVGATAQTVTLLSSVFWGFAAGFGIYIANLFGARRYSRIKQDIYSVVPVMSGALLGLGLLVVLCQGPLFDLLQVDPAIRQPASVYFTVYTLGLFLINMNNTLIVILNAFGSSSFPFVMSLVSAALNVGGNLLSVLWLGWGVAGLAISSVFSAAVVDVCLILQIRSCFRQMGVGKERVTFRFGAVRRCLRYALPTSLQQTAMYIAAFAVSPLINGLGSAATAAYTVVMRVYEISAAIYQNSAKTLSNYAAQCVGAQKIHCIRKGLLVGLAQGVLFVLPVIVACGVWAEPVTGLFFTTGAGGDAWDYSVLFARVYLPFVLFNLVNNLFHAYFRGIAAMGMLVLGTAFGSVVRLAAGVVCIGLWGMEGLYISWAISWAAEALLMLGMYLMRFATAEKLQRFLARSRG